MRTDIDNIKNYAQRLKDAIHNNELGFDRELLHFAQQYALTPETRKKAVLATYKLARATTDDNIKTDIIKLIDNIVADFSPVDYYQLNSLLSAKEREFSQKYNKNREITFKCSQLKKSFKQAFTLGEVDLSIRKGDITGVIGENGNGKTTFFRMVAGELAHDTGIIEYPFLQQSSNNKKDIDWALVKSRIAFVPQELPSWYGNLRHHLQYEAAIHGIKGKDNLLQVDYIIERLSLQNHIDKKWKELSGGFKFRFALAKALVWQPDMMILDEPLANLDVNAQLSILRDIKHLATSVTNPIAVFISSQHLHEIEAIADNLLFLREGKVIFNDSIKNLGAERTENTFEIGTSLNYQQFIALFSETMTVSIRHYGLHYIVTTPLSFSKTDLLKILIAHDIDLHYFRDISCSSKMFFMQAA